MSPLSIFLIIAFLVLIVVFVVLTVKNKSGNSARKSANVIIPFSGYLSPPNPAAKPSANNVGTSKNPEDGLFLVGMGGGLANNTPQIQCPVGTKINIIGAFLETNDPFGECYGQPLPSFKLSCGSQSDLTAAQTCQNVGETGECPQGMVCGNTLQCIPNSCTTHADCVGTSGGSIKACDPAVGQPCGTYTDASGNQAQYVEGQHMQDNARLVCRQRNRTDANRMPVSGTLVWTLDPVFGQCMMCDGTISGGPGKGTCVNVPLCANTSGNTVSGLKGNDTCSSLAGRCKVRDASAHLAGWCDGKSTCLGTAADKWLPNQPGGPFGPLPCDIPAKSTDPDYQYMPIIPGWNANVPPSGSSVGQPASFSQGYYVHGIYTCIPDEELAQISTPAATPSTPPATPPASS